MGGAGGRCWWAVLVDGAGDVLVYSLLSSTNWKMSSGNFLEGEMGGERVCVCMCVCLSVRVLIVGLIGLMLCLWSRCVGMAIQPMNLITRHHHPSQYSNQLGPQEAGCIGQEDIQLIKTAPQEPPLLSMQSWPAANGRMPGLRNTATNTWLDCPVH